MPSQPREAARPAQPTGPIAAKAARLIPNLKSLGNRDDGFIPLVAILVIDGANAGPIHIVGSVPISPQLSPSLLFCAILNGSVAISPAGVNIPESSFIAGPKLPARSGPIAALFKVGNRLALYKAPVPGTAAAVAPTVAPV